MAIIRRPTDGAILVQRDRGRPDHDWDRLLGGHVEHGEPAEDALRRELREEIGEELVDVRLLDVLENHFTLEGRTGHEVVFVFDAAFAQPAAYEVAERPILDHAAGDVIAWWRQPPGTAPLYPDGVLDLLHEPLPSQPLEGRLVRLRPTTRLDRDALVAIRGTPQVRERWRDDDLEAEFDDDLHDPDLHRFTIEDRRGRILGLIQYAEVDDADYRSASVDLYVDPAVHRRGVATDAIETLVDHLIRDIGHHRLTIDPAADNIPAIECYAKVGFRPVGVMRRYERQADDSWADGLLMELLADDRDSRA